MTKQAEGPNRWSTLTDEINGSVEKKQAPPPPAVPTATERTFREFSMRLDGVDVPVKEIFFSDPIPTRKTFVLNSTTLDDLRRGQDAMSSGAVFQVTNDCMYALLVLACRLLEQENSVRKREQLLDERNIELKAPEARVYLTRMDMNIDYGSRPVYDRGGLAGYMAPGQGYVTVQLTGDMRAMELFSGCGTDFNKFRQAVLRCG